MYENKMSKIERGIKLFDIYGSYFNLRINNQAKFKSILGGVLSIMTMGVFLFCILSFGEDFYLRKNPKVSIKEGFYDDGKIPVLNGTEYEEKSILFAISKYADNIIEPVIFYSINNTILEMQKCPPYKLVQNNIIESEEEIQKSQLTYYCLNLNDFKIGPNSISFSAVNSALAIQLMECSEASGALNKPRNCNEDFANNPDRSIPFLNVNILYEKIGFNPDNLYPFQKKLSSFAFILESQKFTKIEIPLVTYRLEDDRGLISPNVRNATLLNVNPFDIVQVVNFRPNYPRTVIKFFISDDHKTYYRSYQKLQDLLAAIGGFMKLIFTALNIFNFIIRSYLIDMHILDTLFRKEEDEYNLNKALKANNSLDSIKSSKKRIYLNF